MRERDAILELWREARSRGEGLVLATVCEVRGSAYRRPGARMLLCAGGRSAGVINGGCLDGDLWSHAREIMRTGRAELLRYDTTSPGEIVWGLGLGCRGVVKILLEPAGEPDWFCDGNTIATFFEGERLGSVRIRADATEAPRVVDIAGGRALVETLREPAPLWIFGAGADVAPLAGLGAELGWAVKVIDLRAEHPERRRHPAARTVLPEHLGELEISPRAACVVMTHHFLHDLEVLRVLVASPARYIGVLGPRSRTDALLGELRKEGEAGAGLGLARVYAPVGLDIGAETPEEIALAILAEIRAVTAGRSGGCLREREGGIHGTEGGRTGIVILAAGESARMGEAKQLLRYQGRSLLRRTVEAAVASRCAPVAVVVGARGEQMREELADLPVRIVRNDEWRTGLSTSVRAGLAAVEEEVEAVVFAPCDLPGLGAEVLDRLVAAHEARGKGLVVSGYRGTWGAPMLVGRGYWGELRELAGDRGAQGVAYRHPEEVECVAFPEGAFDIDTREDYEALLSASSPMKITIPETIPETIPGEAALQTSPLES